MHTGFRWQWEYRENGNSFWATDGNSNDSVGTAAIKTITVIPVYLDSQLAPESLSYRMALLM